MKIKKILWEFVPVSSLCVHADLEMPTESSTSAPEVLSNCLTEG